MPRTETSSPRRKTIDEMFGDPGVPVGTMFENRAACMRAGVHGLPIAGIHGRSEQGAFSIVMSGGYEDDHDEGHTFTYTGCAGRSTGDDGKLIAGPHNRDQSFGHPKNRSLQISSETRKPVRVIRGSKLESLYAPDEGYRYDGLYIVEEAFKEKGKGGFMMCRYKFKRIEGQPPILGIDASTPSPSPPPSQCATLPRIGGEVDVQIHRLHSPEDSTSESSPSPSPPPSRRESLPRIGGELDVQNHRLQSPDDDTPESSPPPSPPPSRRAMRDAGRDAVPRPQAPDNPTQRSTSSGPRRRSGVREHPRRRTPSSDPAESDRQSPASSGASPQPPRVPDTNPTTEPAHPLAAAPMSRPEPAQPRAPAPSFQGLRSKKRAREEDHSPAARPRPQSVGGIRLRARAADAFNVVAGEPAPGGAPAATDSASGGPPPHAGVAFQDATDGIAA